MGELYDVVVVGAGPGGSSAAYYLSRAGLKILLLDKATFPREKTCGDCLTPQAVAVLEEMGLLDVLLYKGHKVNSTQIFAPGGHSTIAEFPEKNVHKSYGLVVPRLLLDNLIVEKAQEAGACFVGGINVTELKSEGQKVLIKGEKGQSQVEFEGRLLIIATGANPRLLPQMSLLDQPSPFSLATRAYYELPEMASDSLQFYFDRSIPVPGYGWVFPVGKTDVNVGTCCFCASPGHSGKAASSRQAFVNFVKTPVMVNLLAGSRLNGPIKGYPIRTNFLNSKTSGTRVLLVGEAAGLVNPATAEGIDYALESGRIAAAYLAVLFAKRELNSPDLRGYDRLLRKRFVGVFRFCQWSKYLFMHYPLLNWEISMANWRPELRHLITKILLST